MAYHLTIPDKKSYDWLQSLVNNTLDTPTSRPYQMNYEELLAWKAAFDICNAEREKASEARKAKAKPSASKKKSVSKKRKKKEISEYDCEIHHTYGGVKRPRTDCIKCWSIYKKLHPQEYDRARRSFKLKQRQK